MKEKLKPIQIIAFPGLRNKNLELEIQQLVWSCYRIWFKTLIKISLTQLVLFVSGNCVRSEKLISRYAEYILVDSVVETCGLFVTHTHQP